MLLSVRHCPRWYKVNSKVIRSLWTWHKIESCALLDAALWSMTVRDHDSSVPILPGREGGVQSCWSGPAYELETTVASIKRNIKTQATLRLTLACRPCCTQGRAQARAWGSHLGLNWPTMQAQRVSIAPTQGASCPQIEGRGVPHYIKRWTFLCSGLAPAGIQNQLHWRRPAGNWGTTREELYLPKAQPFSQSPAVLMPTTESSLLTGCKNTPACHHVFLMETRIVWGVEVIHGMMTRTTPYSRTVPAYVTPSYRFLIEPVATFQAGQRILQCHHQKPHDSNRHSVSTEEPQCTMCKPRHGPFTCLCSPLEKTTPTVLACLPPSSRRGYECVSRECRWGLTKWGSEGELW